ncbi:peptide-methionine (S)-S-oxide reductase MsrA [Cyanobacterium stanieri LEGE 03274]|uniref:Peptide methionine sulfoxide reductase MsrA n=1 Tax=Cyanobacterium stanieri LEGE 03274 TaxID=1828756 RepID=A0ABR9V031_9CHRO|nr:peptide-methionine (S)-S-oxide reductase MsrA [Cyanobacterium stanieri]MBE9221234.1 peptide-methionine (S)-S-oxide reductase MsrA [Cyanobacterium stanieri LEGE 03274]
MKKLLLIILLFWLTLAPVAQAENITKATFAGGCFWCMEEPFDQLDGVISTTSGYTGGRVANPTYKQVSAGNTGHAESVQIEYDSDKVSYDQLLDIFWHNVDPTVQNRQFCDVGNQYRTAVFYHNQQQKSLAETSKDKVAQELNSNIYTEINPATEFYPAEDYHQNYYQTNTLLYKFYRSRCGRDRRLAEVWGK